jgi:hypothetical protein
LGGLARNDHAVGTSHKLHIVREERRDASDAPRDDCSVEGRALNADLPLGLRYARRLGGKGSDEQGQHYSTAGR